MSDTGIGMPRGGDRQGVRSVLHDQSRRAQAPASASARSTASSGRAAATSGSTARSAKAPRSRSTCRAALPAAGSRRAKRRRRKARREAGNGAGGGGRCRGPRLCHRDVARRSTTAFWRPPMARRACAGSSRSEPIDLLLTDVVMPGMNGRALGDAAQTAPPGAEGALHDRLFPQCHRASGTA